MARARRADGMISRLLKQIKPKAKSVIVTIYGDAITHHGGSAWLGSIIKLAAPLGLNERVVRTSVFRLAKEDWLVADQVGRRSYYRLTEAGRHRFDTAHSRIYHHASRPWDGHWTFVIIDFAALKGKNGEALRSDLRWQGFGQLTAGVMLHPDPDKAALHQALVDADASKRALVMHAAAETATAPAAVRGLVERCWDLQRLAADYAAFLDTFRPVWQALHHAAHLDPETCFVVRTLLMHSYRRRSAARPETAGRIAGGELARRVGASALPQPLPARPGRGRTARAGSARNGGRRGSRGASELLHAVRRVGAGGRRRVSPARVCARLHPSATMALEVIQILLISIEKCITLSSQ